MSVVYRARHLTLKRTVALKMILTGGHAGPGELARFRTEAEAVARLQHPNIVQIHEIGEAGGHPYCALEFIAGGTLATRIKNRPMSAGESARVVETLARAMQLAHSRNVVHRDLKPANVLQLPDGTPKISDFGLARQLDSDSSETQAGAVMGTPSYMAPEQASGRTHEAGPAADVYALGAILYECLTGRPPFKGATSVETLDQVRTREPVPPSRVRTGVPLDLETVCLKCLRKEPERRYASAAELADELGRHLRGEPVLARPVGRAERGRLWCRRNPKLAVAVGVTVTALVASSVVSTLFGIQTGIKSSEVEKSNIRLAQTNTELEQKNVALAQSRAEVDHKNAGLGQKNTELVQLDYDKEGLLVRTWLTPLADAPSPYLNSAELFAFAELAASNNERKKRFMAEAVKPEWRQKLGARAEFLLHAIVGLDPEARREVERLLVGELERLDPADPSRTDLALAAARLGELSPPSAAVVVKVLLSGLTALAEALVRAAPTTGKPLSIAQALARVAPRLEPKESARISAAAVTTLTRAMVQVKDQHTFQALADGLVALGPQLGPEDAATTAAFITQTVIQSNHPFGAVPWAKGLSAVAPRLTPDDAAKTATVLGRAMSTAVNPDTARAQAECLSALAPRLTPTAAAVTATALGRAITDSRANRVQALQYQAEGMTALLPRLEPREAARLTATAAVVLTETLAARRTDLHRPVELPEFRRGEHPRS